MVTLHEAVALSAQENGLAIVSTLRADATIQASLINAAAMPHPGTGEAVLAFVTYGKVKLANLRSRPQISVVFRRGGQWATVEGYAELVGPDDPTPWLTDADALRRLLREIYSAAGGVHDDWGAYDDVMRDQRRAAVFVTPTRIYSND